LFWFIPQPFLPPCPRPIFSFPSLAPWPCWAGHCWCWPRARLLVLSGTLPLGLAAAYTGLIAIHYLGPHRGEGGFGSLAQVAALFRDPWALLAGWVHYLCFDLAVGSWETRDAHRRGVPHLALVPCLLTTFLVGPLGLLLYSAVRRAFGREPLPAGPPR